MGKWLTIARETKEAKGGKMFKRGIVPRNRTPINILISMKMTANQLWLGEMNYSLIHVLHKNAKRMLCFSHCTSYGYQTKYRTPS